MVGSTPRPCLFQCATFPAPPFLRLHHTCTCYSTHIFMYETIQIVVSFDRSNLHSDYRIWVFANNKILFQDPKRNIIPMNDPVVIKHVHLSEWTQRFEIKRTFFEKVIKTHAEYQRLWALRGCSIRVYVHWLKEYFK